MVVGCWLLPALLATAFFHGPSVAQQALSPCAFNPMCTCKSDSAPGDVSCVGVPFAKLPDLPTSPVSHMDVVSSGLEAVENDVLGGSEAESLRLMSNRIQYVGERAFSSMSNRLRSLDLSYNELPEIPFESFQQLLVLEWLNLHSNQIAVLEGSSEGSWSHLKDTLTNVFLGENDLTELPRRKWHNGEGAASNGNNGNGGSNGDAGAAFPASLAECRLVTWLNVDSNKISELQPGALPPALQTLSASHNLVARFPFEAVDELLDLSWLYLRGNYIDGLPGHTFRRRRRLDKLDLGDNLLDRVPANSFNGSLVVRDLNLDLNYIKHLPAQAFRGMDVGRVYLSMNGLSEIDDRAFAGVGHTLEFLDLEHNHLQEIPRALSELRKLKYLYIPSNNISEVPENALASFAGSLRGLSLSGNHLSRIPKEALRDCKKLSHLNVGYNQIYDIEAEDFEGWGISLDTLLLRNNRIGSLKAHVFRETPVLRELSLSFNMLSDVDPEAFSNLSISLESLEASFGIYMEEFPEDFLKPLRSLLWLALDNNNFRTISSTALYSFSYLQYINLEANRLAHIPSSVFNGVVHKHLRDIRLSYNHLQVIDTDTFSSLESLQTVVLTGNRIRTINSHAFRDLPNFVTLVLSNNRLNSLAPSAFSDLPRLIRLELQQNELKVLSLTSFLNVTNFYMPLMLNISWNQISSLHESNMPSILYMKVLDLSHNKVMEVPSNFIQCFTDSLRRLYMGYNLIRRLNSQAFGLLRYLEVLTLEHNNLQSIRKQAFHGVESLQILDLSHNHINMLQTDQFSNLQSLRIVDLSHNHIRSLSPDVFANTKLEKLDISHNEFVVMPWNSLEHVGLTLRYLDVSHNAVEHLDSTMFPDMPYLLGLNLGSNKLTILPDNVFASLGGLLRLDLSGNPLRANFKELFHYVQRLRHLSLADTGLTVVPHLPLPNLVSLNLSANHIADVPGASMDGLLRLRTLFLCGNRIREIPSNAWPHIPLLKSLDISNNPIKVIQKDNFAGLSRLQHLGMQDLPLVERFDADALSHLPLLASLRVQTWPRVERRRFRLGAALAGARALRRLSVQVLDTELKDQLVGAFGPRLRHLDISGEQLRSIGSGALDGVRGNHELLLQIRGTQVSELPPGLFAELESIPHLTLDISDNRFTSLNPGTLYSNGTSWENVGTRLLSGGLVLKGNPWVCDCDLVWLGHWLRRWLRETMQIHTVALESAQEMQRQAREAACTDPRTGQLIPILELYPEDLRCHASALSQGGTPSRRSFSSDACRWALSLLAVLYWWC